MNTFGVLRLHDCCNFYKPPGVAVLHKQEGFKLKKPSFTYV